MAIDDTRESSEDTESMADDIRYGMDRARERLAVAIEEVEERLNAPHLVRDAKETIAETSPLALAIAAGAGLGWWLWRMRRRDGRADEPDPLPYEEYRQPSTIGTRNYGDMRSPATPPSSGISDSAADLAGSARDLAGSAVESVSALTAQGTRRARGLVYDHPLAVGAIAVAVGIAIGLALPETDGEQDLVSRAVEKAQEMKRRARDEFPED